MATYAVIAFLSLLSVVASAGNSTTDQSALMNIWNYEIKRNVKTTVAYKQWNLAVWEEVVATTNTTADRRYYVTPPVILIRDSAKCEYVPFTRGFDVTYNIQLWERDLAGAVSARLKEMAININEDQINPLPFYQARIVWNNPEDQLHDLKLTTAWVNNLQQQKTYTFRVSAANNASCRLLADALRTNPAPFVSSIQLQFTVSAAKIDSRLLEIKSDHIVDSQLVASMKNLPGTDGSVRYLSSSDYNRMLLQVANQVVADEITSGDYVDADDELSLKDTIANMLNTQKENSAQFDDKMWNSVFWDPLDERPDRVTKELNKFFKINQTDNRVYLNQSGTSSTSANVNILSGMFGGGGSHSTTSSMTQDQMRHLFEQYDIESDIEGDKFVLKKLDLMRMNLNDLARHDVVTTKRVRIRQVDIGGVLQVAAGNSTLAEAEEENRYLRQQLNDMREFIKGELEKQAKETAANILATQNYVKEQIATLTNTLAHSASSNASSTCSSLSTPWHVCVGSYHLDVRDVRCPEGKFLTRFQLIDNYQPEPNRNCRYEYTCCSVV